MGPRVLACANGSKTRLRMPKTVVHLALDDLCEADFAADSTCPECMCLGMSSPISERCVCC